MRSIVTRGSNGMNLLGLQGTSVNLLTARQYMHVSVFGLRKTDPSA